MKNRSPFAVFFLPLITFGIYGLYWLVKTKGEMNQLGAKIPTAWLLIIPFINIYWLWKYCEGVEFVTKGKYSAPIILLITVLLGTIAYAIIQNEFNNLGSVAMATPAQSDNLNNDYSMNTTTPVATETQSVATESQPVVEAPESQPADSSSE